MYTYFKNVLSCLGALYIVNKWAAEFYTSLVGTFADDIDNEMMATPLA